MAKPRVFIEAGFQKCLKNLNQAEIGLIEEALKVVPDCFGQPHAHSGISIRRLHRNIFEGRAGLRLRLLFRFSRGRLEFFFVGDHDEVRRYIREL